MVRPVTFNTNFKTRTTFSLTSTFACTTEKFLTLSYNLTVLRKVNSFCLSNLSANMKCIVIRCTFPKLNHSLIKLCSVATHQMLLHLIFFLNYSNNQECWVQRPSIDFWNRNCDAVINIERRSYLRFILLTNILLQSSKDR
jgi:hypothetical protein